MITKVCTFQNINQADLESLLDQYRYGRYVEDKSLPLEQARRLAFDRTWNLFSQPESKSIIVYSDDGQLLGFLLFRLSNWDTEHFGYNVIVIESIMIRRLGYEQVREIADALIKKFLSWCETSQVRFISTRIPALDLPVIHSLEQRRFQYIENWIYNKHDLDKLDEFNRPSYQLRLAESGDQSYMLKYSQEAFSTHRFHADNNFSRDQAESLYRKWIQSAFDDPKQEILVLDIEDKPAAYMIYYKSDLRKYFGLQYAMWKMGLLGPQSRGGGVGTNFFISLMFYHRDQGLDVIDSGLTTRNITSLNLHTKLNFKVITTYVTFHKWLTNPNKPDIRSSTHQDINSIP